VETRRLSRASRPCGLACAVLGVALHAGCASSGAKRPVADEGTDSALLGQGTTRFRNPEMAAKHQAAKASPGSFEPVYAYARAVTAAALASLVDKSCDACEEGELRYKRRSELDPQYWPIIEEALAMLEALDGASIPAEQRDSVVATKGRLLWLAGRSAEEVTLIEEYVRAHPTAVPVIRRRLELLREDGASAALESQCTRSRGKMRSAPETARVELLTTCVALHPDNADGRSDVLDFATYLPDCSPAEQGLYRKYLVNRCKAKVGSEEARCAEACGCEQEAGKAVPTCKRGCEECRGGLTEKLAICQQLGAPPAAPKPARVSRAKGARLKNAAPKSAPRLKPAPAKRAPPPKPDDPSAPQQAVL